MDKHVVVAMSGGVDSSVAAVLLKQQGWQVTGMMLRLWSESGRQADNRCCTPDAIALARRVAARLDIPFYVVDARQVFRNTVVRAFMDGYARGITPNPCLVCNRHIRWEFLLNQALAVGADFLATGHYVRLVQPAGGLFQLLKSTDLRKDQSYVLYMLGQEKLARTLFPIGGFTKSEVRKMAADFGLPVAQRLDSQDLCFLAGQDYRVFLQRHVPEIAVPGPILAQDGKLLGQHRGLAYYTIGQRKGLGIPSNQPLYVLAKQVSMNALVVGTSDQLGGKELMAVNVNWVSGSAPKKPVRVEVKIRYRASLAWAQVMSMPGLRAHVYFEEAQRDITPGQAVVFYDGEVVLGGGIIAAEFA